MGFARAGSNPAGVAILRTNQAPGTQFGNWGAWMAEWSKALDLSSSGRKSAWVRTPLQALFFKHQKMTPEGFEPPAFGFGIQRAAVAPWSQLVEKSWYCRVGATIPAVSAWLGPQREGMQAEPLGNPKNKSN